MSSCLKDVTAHSKGVALEHTVIGIFKVPWITLMVIIDHKELTSWYINVKAFKLAGEGVRAVSRHDQCV